jgi:Ni,Fe-hydrogenase I large subunit
MDPNEPFAVINPERIGFLRDLVRGAKKFVEQVYIPDVLAIAGFYKDWFTRGEGVGNFLSYGDYPSGDQTDASAFLFPRGIVLGRDISKVHPVDPAQITESISHAWYDYSDGDKPRHPFDGETNPKYSGPKPPYEFLEVDKKYLFTSCG